MEPTTTFKTTSSFITRGFPRSPLFPLQDNHTTTHTLPSHTESAKLTELNHFFASTTDSNEATLVSPTTGFLLPCASFVKSILTFFPYHLMNLGTSFSLFCPSQRHLSTKFPSHQPTAPLTFLLYYRAPIALSTFRQNGPAQPPPTTLPICYTRKTTTMSTNNYTSLTRPTTPQPQAHPLMANKINPLLSQNHFALLSTNQHQLSLKLTPKHEGPPSTTQLTTNNKPTQHKSQLPNPPSQTRHPINLCLPFTTLPPTLPSPSTPLTPAP